MTTQWGARYGLYVLRSLYIGSCDRFQSLLGASSSEGPQAVQGGQSLMLKWLEGKASWELAEAYFKVKLLRDMDSSVAG